MITSNIDYIIFTSSYMLYDMYDWKPCSGNYKREVSNDVCIIQHGHHKTDDYRHIMQGHHLHELRDKMNDSKIIDMINKLSPTVRRLDIAITHDVMTMSEFWQIATQGVGALARQDHVKGIVSPETGVETVYVGDRKQRAKKGVFRAYNYSLAHGLDDHLTRFELELGRNNANGAFSRLVQGSEQRALLDSYLSFPTSEKWGEIIGDGEIAENYRGKKSSEMEHEKMASRARWLIEQVAPALGRQIAEEMLEYGKSTTYNEFNKVVTHHYKEKLNESDT